jgi:hypothetical protein
MFNVAVSLLLDKMMLETSSYRSKLLLIYVTVAKKVKFLFPFTIAALVINSW